MPKLNKQQKETKERPLLFKGEMVRAIIEDRKTQTRRTRSLNTINENPNDYQLKGLPLENVKIARFMKISTGELINIPCPYGKPGDIFWVRETWRQALSETHECYAYRADMTYQCGKPMPSNDYSTIAWKSPIHMKKAIARIWLECTDIRLERLQDISELDAIAEGARFTDFGYQLPGWHFNAVKSPDECLASARYAFGNLWESIHGEKSWSLNPWVWVVGVKKTERN